MCPRPLAPGRASIQVVPHLASRGRNGPRCRRRPTPSEVLTELKAAFRDYATDDASHGGRALMQQCPQDTRCIPSNVLSLLVRPGEYRKEHHLRPHTGAVPSSANTPIYHRYFEALAGTMPPAADSEQ
jgi:hypothetical protein